MTQVGTPTPIKGNIMTNADFYALTANYGHKDKYSFSLLRDKVVLIVNVASLCGFTPQYNELQALYEKYGKLGFEILAFPCNQFGSQEPYDDSEIQHYVHLHFNVTFPILSKVIVNGRKEDPIYHYLKQEKSGALGFKGVRWNFEKFLIDREGNVVERFDSLTLPNSIEPLIVDLLQRK